MDLIRSVFVYDHVTCGSEVETERKRIMLTLYRCMRKLSTKMILRNFCDNKLYFEALDVSRPATKRNGPCFDE